MNMTCPKCKEGEVEFSTERHSAEDGVWYIPILEKECCLLTDDEIEQITEEAQQQINERLFEDEPF